ncbi:hypothetical protein GCM10011360_20290 [Primorskyibacter flagellatus]|uniref:Uncharacterized protein n=1 Tax=Primorskyibacter flagellatus TaxID=1387277 RepID=A0A917EEY4_9RHOB|nr:hypothetical protein [Primorskyibacter flagellatus]GGE32370.1 hypothetical protein GCM10011360_20290 [Primorskyibacter flagellatus]
MKPISTNARTATGRELFRDKPKKKPAPKTSDATIAIQRGEHGRYQVKSGYMSGEFVARAFPKAPSNARGLIAEATGETEEAAIAALHDIIDARETRRRADRRVDPQTGISIPSNEEYAEALDQVALTRPQRAMLTTLALAGDDGLTDAGLARSAGYKSRAAANRAFTNAGKLIANYLDVQTSSESRPNESGDAYFLGYRGPQRNEDDPGNWILHAEVRYAVRIGM